MFCSFLCYNAQNDILSLSSRIDKFVYPSTDFSSLHNSEKTSVCTYLSLLYFSFKVLWNFFQRSLSFLHPGELVVVSFPKASAKLHGLCELTKFFGKKFLKNFRRLSRKLRYAPYSHGFKAHKKNLPENAFLVPTKGGLVQTRRDANANLCLSYRPAKFFNRIFTHLCP